MTRGGNGEPSSITDASGLGVVIPVDESFAWNSTSSSLDTVTKQWKSNPYAYANLTHPATASVASIEIFDSATSSVVVVQGRSVPIVVSVSIPHSVDPLSFRCGYWDVERQLWVTNGLVMLAVGRLNDTGDVYVVCGTVHLSDFSGITDASFLGLPDPNDFLNIGLLSSLFDLKNLLPVSVVFAVIGFFIVSWVISYRHDMKMGRELAQLRRAHQLTFGEISGGFGRDRMHLDASEAGRVKLKAMEDGFRVRA